MKDKKQRDGQKKNKEKRKQWFFPPKPGVNSILLKQAKGRKERQQPKRNIK